MKKGFTLAETLITLAIIGVVSALTIPNLIEKHNEKVWLGKFKQTHALLTQATLHVIDEYGDPTGWNFGKNTADSEKLYLMYAQYLRTRPIGTGIKCREIFPYNTDRNYTKFLDGRKLFDSGTPSTAGLYYRGYCFTLNNGTSVGIIWNNYSSRNKIWYIEFAIDLNGKAGPNTWGKDYFTMYMTTHKGKPSIHGYDAEWLPEDSCKTTGTGLQNGLKCTQWILKYNNMDYLHRDITAEEWKKTHRH